jgi:hypothetical protein
MPTDQDRSERPKRTVDNEQKILKWMNAHKLKDYLSVFALMVEKVLKSQEVGRGSGRITIED